MAITQNGNTWGEEQKLYGYEVRADFINNTDGRIFNEAFLFDKKPSKVEVDKAIAAKIVKLESLVVFEAEEAKRRNTEEVRESIDTSKAVQAKEIISYVLANPASEYRHFETWANKSSWENASLYVRLIYEYAELLSRAGYIVLTGKTQNELYVAVRDFILTTPVDKLIIILIE